jgi:hypothetical protein
MSARLFFLHLFVRFLQDPRFVTLQLLCDLADRLPVHVVLALSLDTLGCDELRSQLGGAVSMDCTNVSAFV